MTGPGLVPVPYGLVHTVVLSHEQLCERRAALLAEAGMSERRLRRLGAKYKLDARQRVILDDLDNIDWLLQPAPPPRVTGTAGA